MSIAVADVEVVVALFSQSLVCMAYTRPQSNVRHFVYVRPIFTCRLLNA